mgnify:CR=1 FL=1
MKELVPGMTSTFSALLFACTSATPQVRHSGGCPLCGGAWGAPLGAPSPCQYWSLRTRLRVRYQRCFQIMRTGALVRRPMRGTQRPSLLLS